MKFWQVAAALIMWKTLEFAYAWAFIASDGQVSIPAIAIMTIVWLIFAGGLWALMGWIFGLAEPAIRVDRERSE